MNSISQKIIQLRKEFRYNQKDFAKRIGVSQPSLIKFEKGETDIIPIGVATKMAKELNVPFAELFEIEDLGSKDSELQNHAAVLETKFKDLEKRIEEKDSFINVLQRENLQHRKHSAYESILSLIDYIVADEIKYHHAKTGSEKIVLNYVESVWAGDLKYELGNYTKEGLLTIEEIIEIIIDNNELISMLEKDSNSISQFVTNFTDFLNRFTNFKEQDLEIFMEKHPDFKNNFEF